MEKMARGTMSSRRLSRTRMESNAIRTHLSALHIISMTYRSQTTSTRVARAFPRVDVEARLWRHYYVLMEEHETYLIEMRRTLVKRESCALQACLSGSSDTANT